MEVINNHLKLRTFLVGDAITVADISLATQLEKIFRYLCVYVVWLSMKKRERNFQILSDGLLLSEQQDLLEMFWENLNYVGKMHFSFNNLKKIKIKKMTDDLCT